MDLLRGIMRLQAVAFAIYGLAFFFVPDFTLETIFDWETVSYWARAVGAIFIPLAWLEWGIAAKLEERRDLIWPFALTPALLLIGIVWEKVADTYDGSDLFLWVTLGITLFFAVAVGGAAWSAQREVPAPG